MADLAREEADRYFSSRAQPTSHPEDRNHSSDHSSSDDDEKHTSPNATSSADADDDDDDMATMTTTQTHPTFHLPTTTSYANTGPKGVIADAQSYQRAKQSTIRSGFTSFTASLRPSEKDQQQTRPTITQKQPSSSSSHSSDSSSDTEFMSQWRLARLAELQTTNSTASRRISPSRRTWGTLSEVDASGYLDAIEKVAPEDVVVVMIFDRASTESKEVEDELGMLAYRWNKVRFVKLDSETAEMREVRVPAVLAYRGGEVFATVSGARGEGLEGVLKGRRVLG